MLLVRRTHSLLGTDAERVVAALQSPGLRVYVARMRGGLVLDTGILGISPQQAVLGSSAVSIQIEGTLGVRASGREYPVDEGSVAVMRVQAWNERWEGDFRVLVFEWSKPLDQPLPNLDASRIGPSDRQAFSRFANRIEAGELLGELAAHAVVDAIRRLNALGIAVPQPSVESLHQGAPKGAQELAQALGDVLSGLHLAPQTEELAAALGISVRQVNRRLQSLGEWLPSYSRPQAWRRQLTLIRSTVAASFLTRKDVPLEVVARSLGYGSSRALLLALSQAGLPAPNVLRSA